MSIALKQVRPCDGQCCKESPRFPTRSGKDCIYRTSKTSGKDDIARGGAAFGCALMRGVSMLDPEEMSVIFPSEKAQAVFERTCVQWPQNTKISWTRKADGTMEVGSTAGCCWQWISDGL